MVLNKGYGGFLKLRCPKCGGNLFLDWDYWTNSYEEKCLQCARINPSPFSFNAPKNQLQRVSATNSGSGAV